MCAYIHTHTHNSHVSPPSLLRPQTNYSSHPPTILPAAFVPVSREQAAARLDHKNGTLNLGDKGLEGETRRWQLTCLAKGLQVIPKKN